MPRLPDATDISLRSPRTAGNVVQGPTLSTLPAVSAAADNVLQVGAKRRQEADRFAVLSAEGKFAMRRQEILAGLDKDEKVVEGLRSGDFGVYETRYNEEIQKAREEVAVSVRDPYDRQLLQQRLDILAREGAVRATEQGRVIRGDRRRAALEENLAGYGRAMTTDSNPMYWVEMANEGVQALIDDGDITAEAGGELRRKFAVNGAVGRLEMMKPEARLEALSSTDQVVGLIPPDVREKMKEQAKSEIRADESYRYTQEQRAKAERFDQALITLQANPDKGLAAIPTDHFAQMSLPEQQALSMEADRLASGTARTTNYAKRDELYMLLADRSPEAMKRVSTMNLRAEYGPYLNDADFSRAEQIMLSTRADVTGAQAKLATDVVTQPDHQAAMDRVNAAAVEVLGEGAPVGTSAKDRESPDYGKVQAFRSVFWDRYGTRAAELGVEKLPRDEVTTIIDTMKRETIINGGGWWFADMMREKGMWAPRTDAAFNVDVPEDVVGVIEEDLRSQGRPVNPDTVKSEYLFTYQELEDIPKDQVDEITRALNAAGANPTGSAILRAYRERMADKAQEQRR